MDQRWSERKFSFFGWGFLLGWMDWSMGPRYPYYCQRNLSRFKLELGKPLGRIAGNFIIIIIIIIFIVIIIIYYYYYYLLLSILLFIFWGEGHHFMGIYLFGFILISLSFICVCVSSCTSAWSWQKRNDFLTRSQRGRSPSECPKTTEWSEWDSLILQKAGISTTLTIHR